MSKEIKISSLSVGYNNNPIIENINLSTSLNKVVSVIGKNGEGKSTLLKTISGLLPKIGGSFYYKEVDVLDLPENERAKLLSIVSTKQANIGGITVRDYIAYGRFPYTNWLGINQKEDYQEIDKAIALCQLNELEDRNFDELSDGEKQKVNIARAIAQNTPLVVLDEPTAHLDLINKVAIFKLLKELAKNHSKTVIVSTHHIDYAMKISDEIWLVDGKKVASFPINEIQRNNKLEEVFGENLSNPFS